MAVLQLPIIDRWVAIYVRISRDRNGRAENVEVQEQHGRAYAAREWPGAKVVVYCDNDLSAADPGTYRPDYARLLGDIAGGHVAQVVSADQDRLTRQPSEWEALMPVLVTAGIRETHGYRDGITSVELGRRSFGRFKVLMGAEYVEGLKVKITEKLDALAAQGRPHGGAVFGYRRAVNEAGERIMVPDEVQAEVVRWMAAEVLDGRSATSISEEMAERGVTGARGGAMNPSSVKSILTNPGIAGFRSHRGEIIGKGTWEPVLSVDTWEAVRAKLGARPGRGKGPRQASRKYLLSGLVTCGKCGARMVGNVKKSGRDGAKRAYYQCKACGVGISAEPVEQHVTERLLDRLSGLAELRNALAGAGEHEDRRAAIVTELGTFRDRRAEAGRLFADGDIDAMMLTGTKRRLDQREAELRAELNSLPTPVDAVDPALVRDAWAKGEELGDIEGQREIIATFVEGVLIAAGARGKREVDLGRVTITGPGWS